MKAKQILLTLLLTLFAVGVWADDAKIIVWQKDGKTTEILFNQMPEFMYQDGNVSIQNGGTTLSWSLANLQKFTFEGIEDDPTDIKEVKSMPKLDIAKGYAVYEIGGQLIKKQIRSLSELPKGTYILKDGSVTIKVVKQ